MKKLIFLFALVFGLVISQAQTVEITLNKNSKDHTFKMAKTKTQADGSNYFEFGGQANGGIFQVKLYYTSSFGGGWFLEGVDGTGQAVVFMSPQPQASPNPPNYPGSTWNKSPYTQYTLKKVVVETSLDAVEVKKDAFAVYPNPAKDFVTVASNESGIAEVYSMEGRLLKKHGLNAGKNTLDVSALPKGTYILNVNGRAHKLLKK